MDEFSYQTIAKRVENVLIKEKGSKFIGYASAVNSELEVKEYLDEIKALHPKATHHCYAFRLGLNAQNYRANDDGEPSGTAGLPIYNQILGAELTNVLVIVVRYYGGTKLGAAGLIKAYKETAKETLAESEKIIKEEHFQVIIRSDFNKQGIIFSLISKFAGEMLKTEMTNQFTVYVSFKKSQKKDISEIVSEMPDVGFEFI